MDTACPMTDFTLGDAIFARYTAVRNPMGTPIRIAPAVPAMLVRIKGRMPYWGCAAVGAQVSPKRKSTRPIWRIAGMPEMTR